MSDNQNRTKDAWLKFVAIVAVGCFPLFAGAAGFIARDTYVAVRENHTALIKLQAGLERVKDDQQFLKTRFELLQDRTTDRYRKSEAKEDLSKLEIRIKAIETKLDLISK